MVMNWVGAMNWVGVMNLLWLYSRAVVVLRCRCDVVESRESGDATGAVSQHELR